MKKFAVALIFGMVSTGAFATETIDGTCGQPVNEDIDVAMYDEAFVQSQPVLKFNVELTEEEIIAQNYIDLTEVYATPTYMAAE